MPDISVIIPVFNVEQYINECVDSVLAQEGVNLEVILVDDGSLDKSGELCDQIQENNHNVIVIHKINEGLGIARNAGIEYATGKYIAFVDSDDYISQGYYCGLLQKAETEKADVCYSTGINQFGDSSRVFVSMEYLTNITLNSNDECKKAVGYLISDFPGKKDGMILSSCLGLYNLDFIKRNNLRFLSEREYISEDLWFNMDCYIKACKICFCNTAGYNYRYNPKSLSRSYRPDRFDKIIFFTKELKNKCMSVGCDDYAERICKYFWINFEKCINQEVRYKSGSPYKRIKEMCESSTTQETFNTLLQTNYPA